MIWESRLKSTEASGRKLAEMAGDKKSFADLGEYLAYYDGLEL